MNEYKRIQIVTNITNTDLRMNDTDLSPTRKIEVGLMSTLFVFTIVGNLLVIFIILFWRKSRKKSSISRMSFYIIHLSVADINVALMSILPQVIWRNSIFFNKFQLLCKFVAFSQVFSVYASTFLLIVMAYDRYMCICWPIKSCTWTYKNGFFGILLAWLLAAIVSSPQLFLFAIQPLVHPLDNKKYKTCSVIWPSKVHEGLYILFHMSTQFLIPLVILIVFYTNIFLAVSNSIKSKKESLKIECIGGDSPSESATISSHYSNPRASSLACSSFVRPRQAHSLTVRGLSPSVKRGRSIETAKNSIELRPLNSDPKSQTTNRNFFHHQNQSSESIWRFSKKCSQFGSTAFDAPPIRQSISTKTLTKSKIKTLKLTLTVVIAYVLCTLPFYLSNIANFVLNISSKLHSNAFLQFITNLTIITTLLYQLNSCANPFIYMIFNGNACKIIQKEKDLCCTGRGSNNATDTRLKLSVHDRTFQTELSDMTLERNKQEQKEFKQNGKDKL